MREAIDRARRGGWHLRKTLGHGFGRIFCRRVEPGGAVCKVPIFTTPQRPEDRAKDILRAFRDCPHHHADQTTDLSYAHGLVDGAEKLLDAAEDFLDAEEATAGSEEAWQKAQDLLALATVSAEEVDRIMEIAQKFDAEARTLTQRGWVRGAEAGGSDGSPGSYVTLAEERMEEAADVADKARNRHDPTLITLKARVVATKGRIVSLRLRLDPR
ncbi:hypothetical protein [Actinoplanes sp. NPDC051851]|uniref:hypothetical protein n=1 Tax=Actinoplanes sp. NPDC051851 TaxID=3154753 RepID=UPI00342DB9F4